MDNPNNRLLKNINKDDYCNQQMDNYLYFILTRNILSSHGVTAIFNLSPKNNRYEPPPVVSQYADQLDRFTRDFAAVQKNRREVEAQKKFNSYQGRRRQKLLEQQNRKRREDQIFQLGTMQIQNKKNQLLQGTRKNAHTTSLPLNPITLQYQNNTQGHKLYERDQEKRMKDLLRAQYLQSRSSAGYNLLNGAKVNNVQKFVSPQIKQQFAKEAYDYKKKYLLY